MRLSIPSFAAWLGLRLDVVVSVRRQNNHRILAEVTGRTNEDASEDLDLELSLESNSRDAVEVCGAPLQKHLDDFDAPCPKGKLQGGPMRIITAGRAQDDGPYGPVPENRLYVCNPHSKLRGALFKKGQAPQAIASDEELNRTMETLFAEELWKWETSYPNGTSHRVSGEEQKMDGPPKKLLIWVLDIDGNWIIAPENQSQGLVVKHGDLTPGEYPWTRPAESLIQESSAATEVERALADAANATAVPEEKRLSGPYRGLARAGGEIHFYPEDGASPGQPLIEDSSSYAFFRVRAAGLDPERDMTAEEVVEYVEDESKRDTPIARCAMTRFREYLEGPMGLSIPKVMVTLVDPKTRERSFVDP